MSLYSRLDKRLGGTLPGGSKNVVGVSVIPAVTIAPFLPISQAARYAGGVDTGFPKIRPIKSLEAATANLRGAAGNLGQIPAEFTGGLPQVGANIGQSAGNLIQYPLIGAANGIGYTIGAAGAATGSALANIGTGTGIGVGNAAAGTGAGIGAGIAGTFGGLGEGLTKLTVPILLLGGAALVAVLVVNNAPSGAARRSRA